MTINTDPNKPLTIVMFSGGLDSTGALYRVLKETTNEVVAHHINFINREKRYNAESVACNTIVKYLQENIRQFEYTESTFVFPYTRHIGWDIINAMYIGALVAKNYVDVYSNVELCIGDTNDDFGAYKWKSPIAQSVALIASLEDPRHQNQKIPRIIQPVVDLTKKQIVEMIPEQLFMMTWSCRTPIINVTDTHVTMKECGECATCEDLKKINHFKDKEYTITK